MNCAYQLDLAKAYDIVDWGFLHGVPEKMGFHMDTMDHGLCDYCALQSRTKWRTPAAFHSVMRPTPKRPALTISVPTGC